MRQVLDAILAIFRFHKMKIVAILSFASLWIFLIFPFGDLSDMLTQKIAEATKNQVYLQFDDMAIGVLTGVNVKLDNVVVESPGFPPMKASRLRIAPWVMGALSGRFGLSVDAMDLFGGLVAADVREGDKLKSGLREMEIGVEADQLKLNEITKILTDAEILKLALDGVLKISTQLKVDPFYEVQPSGAANVTIGNLTLPAQTLELNLNGALLPVPISEMKLGPTRLNAKIGGGQFDIQELSFGTAKEMISGKAKGNVGVSFRKMGPQVVPTITGFDLNVTLTIDEDFAKTNVKAVLDMLNAYKRVEPGPNGTANRWTYNFRLQPPDPGSMFPKFSAPQ